MFKAPSNVVDRSKGLPPGKILAKSPATAPHPGPAIASSFTLPK